MIDGKLHLLRTSFSLWSGWVSSLREYRKVDAFEHESPAWKCWAATTVRPAMHFSRFVVSMGAQGLWQNRILC